MPLTQVKASCTGSNCNEMVSFSLANGTSDFYIEQKTGEVFLVPVPGRDTVQSRCNDTGCYLLVRASLQGVSDELSLIIRTVTEDKILVLDIKKPVSDAQIVLDELNSASENYWFRMLNVQPRETSDRYRASDSDSLLFVTVLDIDNNKFLNKNEAGDVIQNMNNEDVGVDNDVDVNNNSNNVNNSSSNDGAVIALSVILALLLLGIIAGFVFYKRKTLMEFYNEKIKKTETKQTVTDSSSDNSTRLSFKSEKRNGVDKAPFRQSVAIHTTSNINGQRSQPGVPGVGRPAVGPQHSGMMGQMGSELESRLHKSEERRGKSMTSFEDQGQVSRGKKSAAPAAPGIKFNERAEVVEVEVKSETESDTEDSSSDSSDDESTVSVASNEQVTRI